VLAGLLIVIFDANTDELIPLYAVGVFLSFTLSQSGMVMKWRRERPAGWRKSALINGVGAVATGLVFLVIGATKFNGGDEGKPMFKIGDFQVKEGAWIVMIIIPLMVGMFKAIYRHYNRVASEVNADDGDEEVMEESDELRHLAVVPIAALNRVAIRTLTYARSIFNRVQAVYVTDSEADAEQLRERWQKRMAGTDIGLVILESPYRALVRPLVTYVDDVQRKYPDRQITVVLPEFVASRWWEHILHNQTALRLKGALLFHPGIVVTSVPYHIGKPLSVRQSAAGEAPPDGSNP
jgi:hypothetical protein